MVMPVRDPSAPVPPDPVAFRVIETFGWDGHRFPRIWRHIARMSATCARFGIAFDKMELLVRLEALPDVGPLRIRATVGMDGAVGVTHAKLGAPATLWRVAVAGQRLDSADPWLQVKTSERVLYERARAHLPGGTDELLFANERGEVCEGSISSVFFDAGEGLRTPPLASGLLPGILRAELLDSGQCREQVLHLEDLRRVRLWIGNSLRGLIPAVLVEGAET